MPEQKHMTAPALPWPYVDLDPNGVLKEAYNNYYVGGCMYATGKALVDALINSAGSPWDSFNPDFFRYGSGGIASKGTLCGSLNAAAAVIQLAAPSGYAAILKELFNWYRSFSFPSTRMDSYAMFTGQPVSISNSLLCNHSSTKWTSNFGFGLDAPERKDRCAKLAGDVAYKTAELLNTWISGAFHETYHLPDNNFGINFESCFNCHIETANKNSNDNTGTADLCHSAGAACADGDSVSNIPDISSCSPFPWPYVTLDTEDIRKRAYEGYYSIGCMYAVASSLVNTLKEKIGSPWTSVPTEIFIYGSAGVGSWGTVCGALNGACWVIQATAGPHVTEVIDNLFEWYCNTGLPSALMDKYCQFPGQKTTVSNSPLCYVSASTWSHTHRTSINSAERKERCAKLAGDVAAKTAEILNSLKNEL